MDKFFSFLSFCSGSMMALAIVSQMTTPAVHNSGKTATIPHASKSVRPIRPIAAPDPLAEPSSPAASCNRETNATGKNKDKVQPGFVAWHATFSDACKKSKLSGKPVLLFEMLGKLDDEFC